MIQNPKIKYLGVDAGGTFTDFVLKHGDDWRIHKVLSTPDNPAKAILQGISELGLDTALSAGQLVIVHGSTVATNAALERKGARTVYLTNKGLADVLTIGRQARAELYNLQQQPSLPPVPDDLCLEVNCRRDAQGNIVEALSNAELMQVRKHVAELKPEAIAINLLYSYLNDDEEIRLEEALKELAFVSRSSRVLPKYKEYERGMATWLNASLGPKVQHYIQHLDRELKHCRVSMMQSSGGTMALNEAAQRAVNLLLSGPAGGLAAIRQLGRQTNQDQIISFDMGGTSTDVALMDGDFNLSDESQINGWPVAVPMLDMTTIGAGGGSIAWYDQAKMLHVGPQSAGSFPGPVCYGNGGEALTVTDANLVLGRLQANSFLGGQMSLDAHKSRELMSEQARVLGLNTEQLAEGIVRLAEQQMVQALQAISIKKGYNPSTFTLCCFGGAGGMHVCSLAEQMSMQRAIVPRNSGVLSAMGMLCAPKQRHVSKSHICLWETLPVEALEQAFTPLQEQAEASLAQELEGHERVTVKRSLDLRYEGQSYTLNVPLSEDADQAFIQKHRKHYGHALARKVELVNLNVELNAANDIQLPRMASSKKQERNEQERAQQESKQQENTAPNYAEVYGQEAPVEIIERDMLKIGEVYRGPLIVTEHVSTTWVRPNWRMALDEFGNLLLERD